MARAQIDPNSTPLPTRWCTVRRQESEYLVYNSKTDELHLIPPVGFSVLQLCDGQHSIDDIFRRFVPDGGAIHPARGRLCSFIGDLVERGILELPHD